jgi:hypothetical protein
LDHIYLRDTKFVTSGQSFKVNPISTTTLNGDKYDGEIQDFANESTGSHLSIKKGIGVIGWITNSDTFNLTKYYVQP